MTQVMLRPHYSSPIQSNAKEALIPATPAYDPPAAQQQNKGQRVIAGQSLKVIKQSKINTNTYMSANHNLMLYQLGITPAFYC